MGVFFTEVRLAEIRAGVLVRAGALAIAVPEDVRFLLEDFLAADFFVAVFLVMDFLVTVFFADVLVFDTVRCVEAFFFEAFFFETFFFETFFFATFFFAAFFVAFFLAFFVAFFTAFFAVFFAVFFVVLFANFLPAFFADFLAALFLVVPVPDFLAFLRVAVFALLRDDAFREALFAGRLVLVVFFLFLAAAFLAGICLASKAIEMKSAIIHAHFVSGSP